MQVNQLASLLKESKPKFFRYWKLISFFIPFIVILEIGRRNSIALEGTWSTLRFQDESLIIWIVLLMPVNWGLEAYKWYYLMKHFGFHLSYPSSYKTTLTGLAYSLVLPGGIGEYMGRAEAIPEGEGWKGAGVLSIARIAQLYATVLFGGLTLGLFLWHKQYWWLLTGLTGFVLVCWLFFIYSRHIAGWLTMQLKGSYSFLTELLYPWTKQGIEKPVVFFISAVRYMVFTLQFYFILILLGVKESTIDLLSGISSAFMLKSFFPSFLDLGPRELAVTLFFKDLHSSMAQVLSASVLLWFINVMIPGIAGSLLTLRNVILNHRRRVR
ncbi:MAG TPA: lysylphosphatidylglycerol synthase transmembrane domain-containing protein [Cytophagaceae bacterium]|jgi:uncharacterized membrane protein YbhN (UPF0104 family)|nr:lysylphosphatidylglycerol synthase transmembrane domain-containing protein [Cytophagaceae bacterium]